MSALDFLEPLELDVNVLDEELGELGSAKLKFGPEQWAHLSFDWRSRYTALPNGNLTRPLTARTGEGKRFTLFDCKRFDAAVGVGYVVTGDTHPRFKHIRIRYSDISEWYLPWHPLDGTVGETITWTPPQHMDAQIKVRRSEYSLTTVSETSIKQTGEDHILHQHVLFCMEHLTGEFSMEEVRRKVLDLANLLSILIVHPVSVMSVEAVSTNGSRHNVFFPAFKRVERKLSADDFVLRCFTRHVDIFDQWEKVLNRYFNSPYRHVSWTRLAGMQRYDGFWEYRALGYVSLLDKYVDQRTKGCRKIPVTVGRATVDKLDEVISAVSPPLTTVQRKAVVSCVKTVFAHKRDLEFAEKYQHTVAATNPDIVNIVDISGDDFALIKKVRNIVSHGKAMDLPESDLERVNIVVNKIVLLMTYWAFMDFGLTDEDFLRCLTNSFSPLKYGAQPNIRHLDRVTRPHLFLRVSKAQYDMVAKMARRTDICFIRTRSGSIRYSKRYSTAYQDWVSSRTKSGVTKHSDIFGVAEGCVTHLAPAYIECGDALLSLHTAWLISIKPPVNSP